MRIKLYILLLFTTSLFAQKVTTAIDSTQKKIGAEFKLTLKTEVDTNAKVVFPNPQFIGNLEVIQSYKIDTVKKGSRHELIKKYGLTQFDSGKYFVSRLPIIINGKRIYSDSLNVEVKDVVVDTLKQKMYDIKDIAPEKAQSNWWMYVVGLLLFGLLVFGVYYFLKNRPKKEKKVVIEYKTPIEKATSLLQQLEQKELWQKGEIKSYYSELTNIARNYIEEEIHIPAMESTTSELIEALRRASKQKKLKLSNETVANLEKVLKQADLVKFAKSKPLDFEIEEDKKRIANSIVTIHKSIPAIVEKDNELELWNEQQKEKARLEQLRKEKNKKIALITASIVGLIVFVFGFFVITKGFEWTKDKILGNETRELAEGEWILSEYGDPSIKIETPKVLKRVVDSNNKKSKVVNTQKFIYGDYYSKFSVIVTTAKYKDSVKIPNLLNLLVEATADKFEKEFKAKNILFKSEEFSTPNGMKGMRTYGSMKINNPNSDESNKYNYEMLTFVQDIGVQTVIIIYREEDKYGKEMTERILNSAELKTTQ